MPTQLILVKQTSTISLTLVFAWDTRTRCLTRIFSNIFANVGLTDWSRTTIVLVVNPFTVSKGPDFGCFRNVRNCFWACSFPCSASWCSIVNFVTYLFTSAFFSDTAIDSDFNKLTPSEIHIQLNFSIKTIPIIGIMLSAMRLFSYRRNTSNTL